VKIDASPNGQIERDKTKCPISIDRRARPFSYTLKSPHSHHFRRRESGSIRGAATEYGGAGPPLARSSQITAARGLEGRRRPAGCARGFDADRRGF
jgi:hypothetical protein